MLGESSISTRIGLSLVSHRIVIQKVSILPRWISFRNALSTDAMFGMRRASSMILEGSNMMALIEAEPEVSGLVKNMLIELSIMCQTMHP